MSITIPQEEPLHRNPGGARPMDGQPPACQIDRSQTCPRHNSVEALPEAEVEDPPPTPDVVKVSRRKRSSVTVASPAPRGKPLATAVKAQAAIPSRGKAGGMALPTTENEEESSTESIGSAEALPEAEAEDPPPTPDVMKVLKRKKSSTEPTTPVPPSTKGAESARKPKKATLVPQSEVSKRKERSSPHPPTHETKAGICPTNNSSTINRPFPFSIHMGVDLVVCFCRYYWDTLVGGLNDMWPIHSQFCV
ncbi:hypothetical protein DFH27DRAFT_524348 [Peziza echinospora]|nr:hypothetical protein DFH27DRAFT_524348 [Peziza echinospora]